MAKQRNFHLMITAGKILKEPDAHRKNPYNLALIS
jgi:hypothetical protein